MIVGDRKPLEEILASLENDTKVLVAGCGTCVSVCMAGGEKEVGILAEELRMAGKLTGKDLHVSEATAQRQCDMEYLETLNDAVAGAECVVSLACGAGVQYLAQRFSPTRIVPGINTDFIGVAKDIGEWAEFCQSCGDCLLGETGGVCPIARCSKSLLNGPCGGSASGKCEIDSEVDCGWQLIYDRLKEQGRLAQLEKVRPPRSWATSRDGGPRSLTRKDQKA
jgi:ferredoxin